MPNIKKVLPNVIIATPNNGDHAIGWLLFREMFRLPISTTFSLVTNLNPVIRVNSKPTPIMMIPIFLILFERIS